MKNAALVTISTVNRTFSLSLGPRARVMLTLLGFTALSVIAIGCMLIYRFSNQIAELDKRKVDLNKEIVTLNSTVQDLQNEINTQSYAFEKLNELEILTDIPFLNSDYANQGEKTSGQRQEQEHLELDEQQQLLERIDRVKLSLVERKWLLSSLPNGWPLTQKARISSSYGYRIHPIIGRRLFHYGLDLAARKGDPVLATADAVVKFAGRNRSGYGKTVVLSHNYGFVTSYAHLSKILVKKGEFIPRGKIIGEAGNTGISTGTHLHYEVIYLDSKINPLPFIKWNVDNYESIFNKEKAIRWSKLASLIRTQILVQEQQQLLPTAAFSKAN